MAKQIDYPRASIKAALQLADAVHSFAGSCSVKLAAEKLGRTESGAFAAVVGSAAKYDLIQTKGGKLCTTPLYREFKHAYTSEDAARQLQRAVLAPPMFRAVHTKFKGQMLPIGHLDKVLIREFGAPEVFASRLANYFVEGAKLSGLLDGHNFLDGVEKRDIVDDETAAADEALQVGGGKSLEVDANRAVELPEDVAPRAPYKDGAQPNKFTLDIRGPNFNVILEVCEEDDLELVHATIRKIEKAIRSRT